MKKSTTVQVAPETAVAASGWKKTSKITPRPEIQQAGFQEVSAGPAGNSAQNNDTE